eukprot:5883679-Heterocapsa_arctica.AAC.1
MAAQFLPELLPVSPARCCLVCWLPPSAFGWVPCTEFVWRGSSKVEVDNRHLLTRTCLLQQQHRDQGFVESPMCLRPSDMCFIVEHRPSMA